MVLRPAVDLRTKSEGFDRAAEARVGKGRARGSSNVVGAKEAKPSIAATKQITRSR